MDKNDKIYVAGHRGLVGSALMRNLKAKGWTNLLTCTHDELDLTDQHAVRDFFYTTNKPDYVFLAAAKVGGIYANNAYPAEFIHDNLAIQTNIIHEAYRHSVKRLMFLGSSCIYPKLAPQPMREEYLLTGPLEATNRPYAWPRLLVWKCVGATIANTVLNIWLRCQPNLYGPGDNYHPENSHVIPALIRKFHEAKVSGNAVVTVWGTGTPRREFLYSDDMADACIYLMNLPETKFASLLGSDEAQTGCFEPPLVNVGVGEDITIRDLAIMIRKVIGFKGELVFDTSKPDGTPRKLMDTTRLNSMGWCARTPLAEGLAVAYREFVDTLISAQ